MLDEMWEMIAATMTANDSLWNRTATAEKETMAIIDEEGRVALWVYDKVNKKIVLEGL